MSKIKFTSWEYGYSLVIKEPLDLEPVLIEIPNAENLAFTGELVAQVGILGNRVLEVYITKGVAIVCLNTDYNIELTNPVTFKIGESAWDVKHFFGYSDLAKKLYDRIGINYTQEIE